MVRQDRHTELQLTLLCGLDFVSSAQIRGNLAHHPPIRRIRERHLETHKSRIALGGLQVSPSSLGASCGGDMHHALKGKE